MALNYYDTYKQQEILSANRGELLLMMYDGCIKHLKLACIAMEERDNNGAHNTLMKAQDILTVLMGDLDMSFEISGQLMELYRFYQVQITDANIHKDPAPLAPIIEMLTDLRHAWQTAIAAQKTAAVAGR